MTVVAQGQAPPARGLAAVEVGRVPALAADSAVRPTDLRRPLRAVSRAACRRLQSASAATWGEGRTTLGTLTWGTY